MAFFYKEKKFKSEINGELTWRKFLLGGWLLKIAEGEYYSSTYLEEMWQFVFKKIRKKKVLKILIVGSGAGCAVDKAIKFWPVAEITAIDYDEKIMEIGKEIYPYFKNNPKIIFKKDEAENFIKSEKEKFDLIVIDLFVGNKISPLLKDESFLRELKKIILPGGIIIANAASWLTGVDKELFEKWQKSFPQMKIFKFRSNRLIKVEM